MAFAHLTDRQWQRIEPYFRDKPHLHGGRTFGPPRRALDGILWILSTGAPWRSLPDHEYGHWETVYGRFHDWRESGAVDSALQALQVRFDRKGLIDWSTCMIDGTSIRASRAASGARKRGDPHWNLPIMRSAIPAGATAPRSSS